MQRGLDADKGERGQAVVLVAAAAMALMAMVALVIDVSNLYVQQRKMQNAADAAAMVGAQHWLAAAGQLDTAPAIQDARIYATYNGYTTSVFAGNGVWDPASGNGVVVSIPPATGPYSTSAQFVEVIVSKPVTTFFGGVLNVNTVQVSARAVAKGISVGLTASVIALSSSPDAISNSGSSSTNVYGSVYSSGGIRCNSGNLLVYQGAAYAVGGFGPNCQSGQLQADQGTITGPPAIFDPEWPSFESLAPGGPGGNWSSIGQPVDPDGYIHVPAGTYNSISVQNGANVKFDGGVYHLQGQGDNPALDIRGNVISVSAVQFVLDSGAVHFEAQATGMLSSGPEYNNILIYSKCDDGGTAIQITGGAVMTYNGTIYAPGCTVAISGNSAANVNGQVVANQVTFAGNSGTAIQWDSGKAATITEPELYE